MGSALLWPNLHKSIIIIKYVKLIFATLLDVMKMFSTKVNQSYLNRKIDGLCETTKKGI